ncbi:MAG: nitroreductase [Novosphingobium sp.]
MNVTEAVAARRSTRRFLGKGVDEAVLRRVLEKAQMAPSSMNFQPWFGVVLTGEPLAALSREMMASDPQSPAEYPLILPETPQKFIDRREAIMAPRMESLGIERTDMAARNAYQRKNFEFFGAPVCLFSFVPRNLAPNNWASVGLWYQTVMLLLVEEGLASCPQEFLSLYAPQVKTACGVDDADYFLWCGLSIGWPDKDAPVNNYHRPRVPLDESVRFQGF